MQKASSWPKTAAKNALVVLLAVALVFTMMPLSGGFQAKAAEGEEGLSVQSADVVVTGTGLMGGDKWTADNVSLEKSYSIKQLKKMDGVVKGQMYSARKTKEPYTRIYTIADGIKISALVPDLSKITDVVSLVSKTGYVTSFKKDAAYENDGKSKNKPGLDSGRYFFDGFSASGKTEVPAILSWAYASVEGENGQPPATKPTETEKKSLRSIVGQYSTPDDMNNNLNNGTDTDPVNKILVGDEMSETVFTMGSQKYTRADILAMDFAEADYSYTSKKGDFTDHVKGVPMSVLLKDYQDDVKVTFESADGYAVAASGMTKQELVEGDYMLAYEAGTSSEDMKGIYDTAKDDESIYGCFRLYGNDGASPAKLVNKATVEGTSFGTSPYKHITNGGISGVDAPYNIDEITGATLTIEGPGTVSSVPLSTKDLESQDAGCARANYTDIRNGKKVTRTYEGVDLYYILNNMSSGDNGIKMTDDAYRVKIKNRNRKTIATFTVAEIKKQHKTKTPILVAYGTSYKGKEDTAKPFVFDDGAGGDVKLGNYDGCLKLVYNRNKVKGNKSYKKFGNMAYIYVEQKSTPGFKHNKSPYKSAENSQYVLTITGKEIGREVNFTVEQLENMVKYNKKGKVKKNKYAYRDSYSLANSTYWYVNEYEGVKLWSLLQTSGVAASKGNDKETMVKFKSTDNYGGFDTFSLYQVAHPKSFGFYEKNALDNNDGTYVPNENLRKNNDPSTGDKLKEGYPVLVAYGVNGYPYVKNKNLKGYMSGLQNDGGPLRVISGKQNYNHPNGSNQAKLLEKVVVGSDEYDYATHVNHEKEVYKNLADDTLKVKVTSGNKILSEKDYKVSDIENIIYDGNLSANQLSEAKVKEFYETKNGKKYENNFYEGVNLNYFLSEVVKLSGSQGEITFTSDSGKTLTKDLETVLNTEDGYNKATKLEGLSPVLAYAKNGAPLVENASAEGYEGTVKLAKGTAYARSYKVKNSGGPLKVVMPRASSKAKNTMGSLDNVSEITIDLNADKYTHTDSPYDTYADQTITISGEGTKLTSAKDVKVSEIEGNQKLAATADYSFLNKAGTVSQTRYRGVSLYEFLKSNDIGLKNNADEVIITSTDGAKTTLSLNDISKTDYINSVTGAENLTVMLAFGSSAVDKQDTKDGLPLVQDKSSQGYDAAYGNDGGPLKLVVGQKDAEDVNNSNCVKNVKSIEITAKETESWNHNKSATYQQYLNWSCSLKVVDNSNNELFSRDYTVEDIENMSTLIYQDQIDSTQTNTFEGVDFWQFITSETASTVPEVATDPISVNVSASSDGYTQDVLAKVKLEGLKNGVKDGSRYVKVMLAYGMDGLPLVTGDKTDPNGDGYDSVIGNNGGPLRLMVHNSQGACITEVNKIVVKVK